MNAYICRFISTWFLIHVMRFNTWQTVNNYSTYTALMEVLGVNKVSPNYVILWVCASHPLLVIPISCTMITYIVDEWSISRPQFSRESSSYADILVIISSTVSWLQRSKVFPWPIVTVCPINSLWPSDAMWPHRYWSTLAQVTLPDGTKLLLEPRLTNHQ